MFFPTKEIASMGFSFYKRGSGPEITADTLVSIGPDKILCVLSNDTTKVSEIKIEEIARIVSVTNRHYSTVSVSTSFHDGPLGMKTLRDDYVNMITFLTTQARFSAGRSIAVLDVSEKKIEIDLYDKISLSSKVDMSLMAVSVETDVPDKIISLQFLNERGAYPLYLLYQKHSALIRSIKEANVSYKYTFSWDDQKTAWERLSKVLGLKKKEENSQNNLANMYDDDDCGWPVYGYNNWQGRRNCQLQTYKPKKKELSFTEYKR